MPWSRYQPHGFILSYRYIPVNRIRRFYGMFVWMWRAAFCISFETHRSLCIDSSFCNLPYVSIEAFCPRFTPVFFPLSGKKRRLAASCVSIPPGRDRHSCVLAVLFGYLPLWVHFGFVRLFVAISTGLPGMRGTENGGRGWRRGLCASLHNRIGIVSFSAGRTLGLNVEAAQRPPQTAPKSLRLSGLSSRCGGVVLVWIRCAVTRVHGKT